MTAPHLWDALLATLDDEHAAQLAQRLHPHLTTDHRLLTATEAAERLGLHPKTVVRMAREGRIPAVRIGSGWRFDPEQLHIEPRPRPAASTIVPAARRTDDTSGERASVRAIRGELPGSKRRAA